MIEEKPMLPEDEMAASDLQSIATEHRRHSGGIRLPVAVGATPVSGFVFVALILIGLLTGSLHFRVS